MVFEFSRSERQKAEIISLISKPEAIKGANKVIEDVQIKLFISSENSAIMYQVNKAYNRLYRPRDFVFIRHMFSDGNKLYMIDKSVENSNYPPFMTIVRGELCIVWGVLEEGSQIKLIADVLIKNEGYVNAVQEFNLTAQLLKGYVGLKEASA